MYEFSVFYIPCIETYRNFPCIMRKILLIYCPEIWGAHYAWVQKIWKKISVEISGEYQTMQGTQGSNINGKLPVDVETNITSLAV